MPMPTLCRAARALPILALVFFAACAERPAGGPHELRAARLDARRDACISAELRNRADDNVELLEQLAGVEPEPGQPPAVGRAAFQFALAYQQHATLQATASARIDSAFNHARTSPDSARHMQLAEQIVIRMPETGTLEANVMESYTREFDRIRANPDHPCNW